MLETTSIRLALARSGSWFARAKHAWSERVTIRSELVLCGHLGLATGDARSAREAGADVGGLSRARVSDGDDDLSLGVSFSLVPEGLRQFAQLVAPIDDRRDLSGFDELLQDGQVLPVVPDDEHARSLAHER